MKGFLEKVAFSLYLENNNGRIGKGIQVRGNRLAEGRKILDVYRELGVMQFGLKQSKVETKWDSRCMMG